MRVIKLSVKKGKFDEKALDEELKGLGNLEKIKEEAKKIAEDLKDVDFELKIFVEDDGSFYIEVETPPIAELVKQKLGVDKLKPPEGQTIVGDLPFSFVEWLAEIKKYESLAKDKKARIKEILGALSSMPLTVDGKLPKELMSKSF